MLQDYATDLPMTVKTRYKKVCRRWLLVKNFFLNSFVGIPKLGF